MGFAPFCAPPQKEWLNEAESAADFDKALTDARSTEGSESVQEPAPGSPQVCQTNQRATELDPVRIRLLK